MTEIHAQPSPGKAEFSGDQRKEFMLAALRRASACLRSSALELDEIGVSLKFDMITAEGAVSWLDFIGAMHVLNTEPWANRFEIVDVVVPPATAVAAETARNFANKMAPGGKIDRILYGGAS